MPSRGDLKNPAIDDRIWALLRAQGLNSLYALCVRIGRKEQQMTVHRVLRGVNKHSSFRVYVSIVEALNSSVQDEEKKVSLDKLARVFLDYGKERGRTEFEKMCVEAGFATPYALSKFLKWDPSIIGQMARGDHQHIQIRVYRDIARGLGCTLDELSEILLTGKPLLNVVSSDTIEHMVSNESSSSTDENQKWCLKNQTFFRRRLAATA